MKSSPLLLLALPYQIKRNKPVQVAVAFFALLLSGTRANVLLAVMVLFSCYIYKDTNPKRKALLITAEVIDVTDANLSGDESISFEAPDFSAYAVTIVSGNDINFDVKIRFCDDEGNPIPTPNFTGTKYYLVAYVENEQLDMGGWYQQIDYVYGMVHGTDGAAGFCPSRSDKEQPADHVVPVLR